MTSYIDHYKHLPGAQERWRMKIASQEDEQYVIELQNNILAHKAHKATIAKLEDTCKEVQVRIYLRNAQIAPHLYIPDEILGWIFRLVDYEPYCRYGARNDGLHLHGRYSHKSLVSPSQWISRCPFNVSSVCRRWRQVALDTPRLWGHLIVDIEKRNPVQMMEHWFERAKAIPVTVTIWQEEREGYRLAAVTTIKLVVKALGLHMHKVETLKICCQAEPETDTYEYRPGLRFFFRLLGVSNPLPHKMLKTLVIDSMDAKLRWASRDSLLPTFPAQLFHNLTALHLRGFFTSKCFFSTIPINLTILKLDDVAYSQAPDHLNRVIDPIQLLSALPQLRRLRLKGGYSLTTPSFPNPGDLALLPELETLTIVGWYSARYLPFLITPGLKTFKLKGGYLKTLAGIGIVWNTTGAHTWAFLKNNNGSITKFVLGKIGESMDWDVLVFLWEEMGGLRDMVIRRGETDLVCPTHLESRDQWTFHSSPETLKWHLIEQ